MNWQKDVIVLSSSSDKRSPLETESEDDSVQRNQTFISESRVRLMSILQREVTPRYLAVDISDDENEAVLHSGLTQTYEKLELDTVSHISKLVEDRELEELKVRRVKVKADALPEICIRPTIGLHHLQEELGVLPEMEWMTSLREDVQYVLWRTRTNFEPYDYALAIIDLENFYPLIESRSFDNLFSNVFSSYFQSNKFLYITGVKRYIQKQQMLENKHFKETMRSGKLLTPDRLKKVSWPELELDIVIAALPRKIKISIVPDGELGKYLVEMTKCIAWEPHANSQKEELGDASGIAGIRTGRDLSDTWRQMLLAIPRVSDAVATAIQLVYPTLHSLRYAFQLHGPNALMNLSLGKRSLGAALSARIHAIFMKNSPETAINN